MSNATREFCQSCNRVSSVGFYSPIWNEVAGRWRDGRLCIMCFAALGDEKDIMWEHDLRFYPVSLRTFREADALASAQENQQ